jgi:hypothetical protein
MSVSTKDSTIIRSTKLEGLQRKAQEKLKEYHADLQKAIKDVFGEAMTKLEGNFAKCIDDLRVGMASEEQRRLQDLESKIVVEFALDSSSDLERHLQQVKESMTKMLDSRCYIQEDQPHQAVCWQGPNQTLSYQLVETFEALEYARLQVTNDSVLVNCSSSGKIYVIDLEEHKKRVQEFDISSRSHREVCTPRYKRKLFAAACLNNRWLYILGGYNGNDMSKVERIDLYSRSVEFSEGSLVAPRSGMLACAWNDRVYLIGGSQNYVERTEGDLTFVKLMELNVNVVLFCISWRTATKDGAILYCNREQFMSAIDSSHTVIPLAPLDLLSLEKKQQPVFRGRQMFYRLRKEMRSFNF